MKSKTFIILVAICAVLGVATYLVMAPKPKGDMPSGEDSAFVSDLPVNEAATIEIKDAENAVTLAKGESVWVVKSRFDYPADFAKITEFARKLTGLKVGRSFKATEDTKNRLALNPPDKADAPKESLGTRIAMKDKDGKIIGDLLIGSAREASSGQGGYYMMKADGDTIYLVDKDFKYMKKKSTEWIKTDLLDVKADDIREVVCLGAEGDAPLFTLSRPEKGKAPEFVNPPEDKKLINSKITNIFSALAGFRIDDVGDPAAGADVTGLDKAAAFKFHLYDGTVYTLTPGNALKDDENKYYLKASVSYEAPPEPPAEEAAPTETAEGGTPKVEVVTDADTKADSNSDDKPEEKAEDKPDPQTVKAEAEKLNQTLEPWTYIVPKWKATRLIADVEEFFEQPKEDVEAGDAEDKQGS